MATCANPLLLEWVSEWLETARERNTKGVTVYKKAYDSLKKCPLTFSHPSEAQQLTGFGVKICERLTARMKEYCEENDLPIPKMPHKKRKHAADEDEAEDGPEPVKKARKVKPYVPALRSGAYGLVLALATLDEDTPRANGLTKAQTIELAQPHSDASYTAPSDTTKFYTAWNSMKTLVEKDLVYEKGRPLKKYALTEEGWEVAKRIQKTNDPDQGTSKKSSGATKSKNPRQEASDSQADNSPRKSTRADSEDLVVSLPKGLDIIPQGEAITATSILPKFRPIVLPPGSFTVELVLDVREIRARQDRDYMQNNLISRGCKPTMRALELGDILWVAKVKDPALLSTLGAEGDEVLLDWIVERKRLDDLVSSIKDGRFHEQKFRLKKSGVKNVVYLIEEISMSADHFQKYEEAVESAIASMQVVSGYFVKKTQKIDDTIRYLISLTKMLKQRYENQPLKVIPTKVITSTNHLPLINKMAKEDPTSEYHITYSAFASLSSKSESLTLRDVYLKMLMCTRGITGEKALEIQKRWKTPIEFIDAYRKCETGSEEENRKRKWDMVSNEMSGLVGRKKIQKVLSGKIAEVWGDIE